MDHRLGLDLLVDAQVGGLAIHMAPDREGHEAVEPGVRAGTVGQIALHVIDVDRHPSRRRLLLGVQGDAGRPLSGDTPIEGGQSLLLGLRQPGNLTHGALHRPRRGGIIAYEVREALQSPYLPHSAGFQDVGACLEGVLPVRGRGGGQVGHGRSQILPHPLPSPALHLCDQGGHVGGCGIGHVEGAGGDDEGVPLELGLIDLPEVVAGRVNVWIGPVDEAHRRNPDNPVVEDHLVRVVEVRDDLGPVSVPGPQAGHDRLGERSRSAHLSRRQVP